MLYTRWQIKKPGWESRKTKTNKLQPYKYITMKKIININFHSRVIPIEESAYDILKQYIDSLRKHFDNEEGREEIISDIENRFAELFSDRLKKGATCITDENVNEIIASMGRPEDFEKDEINAGSAATGTKSNNQQNTFSGTDAGQYQQQSGYEGTRRLYRSENDKLLGGVCAGLANYLRLDPAMVRIIFALVTVGGFGLGIFLYIIMWIAVPSRSLATNIRKRLYRNPEDKVLGGVASGLAAYFHIDVWVPRLIFALPFILGIITSIFRNEWFDFHPGPVFITGGFGGTLFVTYIILWIVLPEAASTSEKLEMRGEKVDIESIKNSIKSDIEGFKGRAKDMGEDIKQRAEQFANEFKKSTQNFGSEVGPIARRTGTGIGHAIGVLFKAFFLFLAGVLAFALIMVLIGLLFSGVGVFPVKNYLLTGFWQNFFAWASLCLFLGIPILALLTWLIRRIMGVRSRQHYLGYVFGSLWVIGLISFIILIGSIGANFRSKATVKEDVGLVQPPRGKIIIKVANEKVKYYGSDWLGFTDDWDWPFFSLNEDSLMLNTVRIQLVKSADSVFHIYSIKIGRGNSPRVAEQVASRINFLVSQHDSLLLLPKGFAISQQEKFRNQQVLVIVEIPVGKKIEVDRSVDFYRWFNINMNHHRGWNIDWNDDWNDSYSWDDNVEYIMTNDGLENTHKVREGDEEGDSNDRPEKKEGYRYKKNTDTTIHDKYKDSIKNKTRKTTEKNQQAPATIPVKEVKMADSSGAEHVFSPVYNLVELI
jgi:phage shock protein PspC (stress-responsive transcriptional regulator)